MNGAVITVSCVMKVSIYNTSIGLYISKLVKHCATLCNPLTGSNEKIVVKLAGYESAFRVVFFHSHSIRHLQRLSLCVQPAAVGGKCFLNISEIHDRLTQFHCSQLYWQSSSMYDIPLSSAAPMGVPINTLELQGSPVN